MPPELLAEISRALRTIPMSHPYPENYAAEFTAIILEQQQHVRDTPYCAWLETLRSKIAQHLKRKTL